MASRMRHLPNLISSLRMLLVIPIAWALDHRLFIMTFWLFGVAAATDAVDGWLAKRFGWQSELGGLLDPVADKLMLATVFVMLALSGAVPVWLTAAVLARDCIIVTGAVSYRILLGSVEGNPSIISKFNTLCQIIYVLYVIGAHQFAAPSAWATALGALVFVTVVVSGIDYVLVYGRLAWSEVRARRAIAGGNSKTA